MKSLSLFLLCLPALVLGAPSLDVPTPVKRQIERPTIVEIRVTGTSCAEGSYSTLINDGGTGDPNANIGLNAWQAVAIPQNPQVVDREMFCTFTFLIKYPIGCTRHTIRTAFHGYMDLPPEGNMEAKVMRSYRHTQGSADPNSPGELVFDGRNYTGGPAQYTQGDLIEVRAEVAGENQRTLEYSFEARAFVVTAGQQEGYGVWRLDDINIGLAPPSSC